MRLNYFNFKRFNDSILLTNDAGMYIFLSLSDMRKLITRQLTMDDDCYQNLYDRFFLTDKPSEMLAIQMRDYIRNNKSYLFAGPSLHIFVLTNECNMRCIYCQAQDVAHIKRGKMTSDIAMRAVDIALSSPGTYLTFEFQGGEPLLNFDVMRQIILYSESNKGNKEIRYTIASNLLLLTDEVLTFFKEKNISISVSLDGNALVHDFNRRRLDGTGTYKATINGIKCAREAGVEIGAIQTTTKYSLRRGHEMIDTYIELGFPTIFLRPLTRLGMAHSDWEEIGYTPEEYLNFYSSTFAYIIERNLNGHFLKEGYATLFLKKILCGYSENYMELRSPCGATLGQIAYYYDGEIYTCDEGRMLAAMGDKAFCLGSVFQSSYDSLLESPVCKATCHASILESAPTCSSCVYQPYCGTCPVVNYSEYGDILAKQPANFRCQINMGILDILFLHIKKEDKRIMDVLYSWLE